MIKVKGGKIKKVAAGSASSKSVKLAEVKKLEEAKKKETMTVQFSEPIPSGVAYELTLPDGKKQSGKIDASGRVVAQVDPSGQSTLAFPELEKDLAKAKPHQASGKLEIPGLEFGGPIKGLKPGTTEVKIKREIVPIVFVPGIMGSRLKNNQTGKKVWDPDAKGFMFLTYGMAWVSAADKREKLVGSSFDANFLAPLEDDADHNKDIFEEVSKDAPKEGGAPPLKLEDVAKRRWGGVAWSSYGPVIKRLHHEPWEPKVRSRFEMPVYASGYNWTASNSIAGKKLKQLIDEVLQKHSGAQKVIVVTHSMGGLVTRSAYMEHGANAKILAVIHGVQPTTGAAAAYWRIKAGFERNGIASSLAAWVLGTNGEEVTALLGNMPGGLQLLPSQDYKDNSGSAQWLQFKAGDSDSGGVLEKARPFGDPYEEIYKNEKSYWRLVNKPFLAPASKPADAHATNPVEEAWDDCKQFLDNAKAFHAKAGLNPNVDTQSFYGSGTDHATSDKIVYRVTKEPGGFLRFGKGLAKAVTMATVGAVAGPLVAGGAMVADAVTDSDWWQSRGGFKARFAQGGNTYSSALQPGDGGGDGTVPESSGKALSPNKAFPGVEHEPAYRDAAVLKFTIESIEKFCLGRLKKG